MKLLLSLLSLVVMLQITKTVAQTEPCVNGHTYYDGCNQCTCLGSIYACSTLTEKECKETILFSKDSPKVQKREISIEKHIHDNTLRECFHRPQFPNTKPITDEPLVMKMKGRSLARPVPCTENHSYFDGCNTCRCSKGSHYWCTLVFCYNPGFPVDLTKHVNEVTEGSNNVDSSAKATVEDPIDETIITVFSKEPCVEGHSYEEGCYTCRCTSTRIYSCTQTKKFTACFHGPQFPDIFETRTNKPLNSREIEVTGNYDLPKSSDLNHSRFAGESCTPHEVKNEQCNRCKCKKNGRGWICTRKVCSIQEQYLSKNVQEDIF